MTAPTHSYVEDSAKAFLRSFVLQIDTISDLSVTITPTNGVAHAPITPVLTDDAAALKILTTASEFLVRAKSLPGDADIDPDFAYLYNRMVREAAEREAVKKVVRQFGEEYSILTRTERMQWAQKALAVAEASYSEMRKRLEVAQAACADRPTKKARRKLRDAEKNLEQAAIHATTSAKRSMSATNDYMFVLKYKLYWGTAVSPSEAGSTVSVRMMVMDRAREAGQM